MSVEQGKILREFRKKNKMTQETVAAYINISRQNYSHYETGRNQPPIDSLLALAKLWNTNIQDLIVEEKTPSSLSENNSYVSSEPLDKFTASSLLYDSSTITQEANLLQTFRSLSEAQKQEILHYARFLSQEKE